MEKKVIERINDWLKFKHLTTNQLSKILGISPSSVYGYLQGSSKAPMSFVVLLIESFPDISAEWLLRGDGEMLKPAKKSHYLEMAERVNGTHMASEPGDGLLTEPISIYRVIMDNLNAMNERIQKLENSYKK